jgi:hypothetical protein
LAIDWRRDSTEGAATEIGVARKRVLDGAIKPPAARPPALPRLALTRHLAGRNGVFDRGESRTCVPVLGAYRTVERQ